MKIIKFWYFMCLVLFGKMRQEQVEVLLTQYNSYEFFRKMEPKWSLKGLKRGYFKENYLYRILRFWFKRNCPNKDLFKRLLSSEPGTLLYLDCVGKRHLDWEDYEQEAIIKLKADKLKHLSRQLSPKYEEEFIKKAEEEKLNVYMSNFLLSLAAERRLIKEIALNIAEAQDRCDFHLLARRYVKAHPDKAFSKIDAQQLLFELPNCEDVQRCLVMQSTMTTPSLRDVAIETMIEEASGRIGVSASRLLKEFLSISCIENEALIEKFQKAHLDRHLMAMLSISQTRQNLLKTLHQHSYVLLEFYETPYLHEEEKEIMMMPCSADRHHLIKEQIFPKLEAGLVTPAFAAWLAWQYPYLAQVVQNSINHFARQVIDNMYQTEMFMLLRTRHEWL